MDKGICFLDIDGVVNTWNIEYKKTWNSEDGKFIEGYFHWHDRKVNNKMALLYLSKLCIENNLDIYIISDWKDYLKYDDIRTILYDSGLVDKVNFIIPKEKYTMRNKEIKKFLENNPNLEDKYVIIDDNEIYYKFDDELQNHLVLCDSEYGFVGNKKYEEAYKIIQKNKNKILI